LKKILASQSREDRETEPVEMSGIQAACSVFCDMPSAC